jgi:hypothetical protein
MKKILAALCLCACGALPVMAPAMAQDIPPPDQIVAENDKNNDGGIDPMEWAASPAPIPFPAEFDANKDNKINVAELQTMFETMFGGGGPPPGPAPAAPATPAPAAPATPAAPAPG